MLLMNFETEYLYYGLAVTLLSVVLFAYLCPSILHGLQMSNYRWAEYKAYYKRVGHSQFYRLCYLSFLSTISMGVFAVAALSLDKLAHWGTVGVSKLGFLLFLFFCVLYGAVNKKEKQLQKTPLRYTPRVKRLLASVCVCELLVSGCVIALVPTQFAYVVMGLVPLCVLPLCVFANWLCSPWERHIAKGFVKVAQAKLARQKQTDQKPQVIGITGSFGKTTAKNILAGMLSKKYSVCMSPQNYNTPMGLCKTINNHYDGQDILLLEMGARYRGDIQELCQIVGLDFCMLTSVGDCHLETFLTRQAIVDTKCDIVSGLLQEGKAVVCKDPAVVQKLKDDQRVTFADSESECIQKVCADGQGTQWSQVLCGQTVQMQTKLLGEHIPKLVAMCARLAVMLEVPAADIVEAVGELQPIPHRLQLIQSTVGSDTVVIDDAYNANLASVQVALQVLSQFVGYQKVVITPGLVELGKQETEQNKMVGQAIAKHCDAAILVGSRAEQINAGCEITKQQGKECFVQIVPDRDKAMTALKAVQGKKVVLFCNDLPDSF